MDLEGSGRFEARCWLQGVERRCSLALKREDDAGEGPGFGPAIYLRDLGQATSP